MDKYYTFFSSLTQKNYKMITSAYKNNVMT